MSSMLRDSQLTGEREVVWLEEVDVLDYVRQALDKVNTRCGKPRYERDGRLVGYSNLGPNVDRDENSGLFARRTFFLLPHDRPNDPFGPYQVGAPGEAIDPRTIEPGKVGIKTPRSQQGVEERTPAGR
ncbi:DUF6009 family protein [Streptomyces sp. ME01-18a]|uniref:DUF6009 family protein n=1 Tax=Streptomyces sp. ME01-18a TaxID=3028669 RepID=UPI0029A29AFC|nr:DUF6009 family protein [Streptomyces sp. ME01-18a]MDX3434330.1 DUF6009 family protein [Streptomyces sp. ME01-18a]